MNYPYHLGCHLKTGRLCRIPHPELNCGIPVGFVRIIKYRSKVGTHIERCWIYPYGLYDKELKDWYMSLPRWIDIQRYLGEPITGPNMLMVMLGIISPKEGQIEG